MKSLSARLVFCGVVGAASLAAHAQTGLPPSSDPARLEQRVEAISTALAATQQQLEQSQKQMIELQNELIQLRKQLALSNMPGAAEATPPPVVAAAAPTLEEREDALEAAVKVHEQSKVESASKYPVKVTGLILMNAYVNKGVPDNTDLPAVALRQTNTSGNGSVGATFRQTILGLEGSGPRIAGARTSANVTFDFFSGLTYTNYGTSAGVVRMRTASINFDWDHDSVELGMVAPLVSPLSPTSYATVAEPGIGSAGNLWTWAPQLKLTHRQKAGTRQMQYEFGLWDSPAAGYNSNQLFRNASPAELAKQPGYEASLGYGDFAGGGLQIGLGGYYSRQSYPGYQGTSATEHIDAWAGTAFWKLPLAHYFELSGEAYRGRAIGGLGGGVYKDVVSGTDPVTGLADLRALNAIGGWTQFKTRLASTLETNMSIGQDNGFAGDFRALILSPTASQSQLRARNRMAVANLIYRPKASIILSPEYRRIWTWPINGSASTVDVFTLSVGYQF